MLSKLTSFLQESKREFKRVNWPSRKETARLTMVVIVLSLVVAAFLGVLDLFFSSLLQRLI